MEPADAQVLAPGTAVGPYVVIERLGGGGMGQVFLARDSRLQRKVALKYLTAKEGSDETQQAILREARAAARITHPNVAAVYDVIEDGGRAFIVMEFVEGDNLAVRLLRERFGFADVASIGRQLASGLAAAHAEGVIHRDLKPSNVQFARDGTPKILDFGVAKASTSLLSTKSVELEPEQPLAPTDSMRWGGTPLYMSPEQRGGLPVDERSDIYSLGLVLYEMASGQMTPISDRRDFGNAPPALAGVVERALERDPRNRFASAAELSSALAALDLSGKISAPSQPSPSRRWIAIGGAVAAVAALAAVLLWRNLYPPLTIRSLAVLPFINGSNDPEHEYLADGTTDGLINTLGQVSGLKVSARTSSMLFKRTDKTIREIARELNVDAVLEGSVFTERSDHTDSVRVAYNLIDPATEKSIWSDTLVRSPGSLLELQTEIARAVVRRIDVPLTGEEQGRLATTTQVRPEAYRLYVLGRQRWNLRTLLALREALGHFQAAVAIDSTFAPAHAGLADTYALLAGEFAAMPRDAGADAAIAAANHAITLDARSAEAYASLGFANFFLKWNWPAAEEQFRQALKLNPSYATAHQWFGNFLSDMGREDEAHAEMTRALVLDPLSPIISRDVAWPLFYGRRYDAAIQQLQTTLASHPGFLPAERLLARALAMSGRAAEAVTRFEQQRARDDSPRSRAELAWAYARAGRTKDAERALEEARQLAPSQSYPYDEALVLTALGRKEGAFDALNRAYDQRDPTLVNLKHDPRLELLHSDPRFARLLALMRFP